MDVINYIPCSSFKYAHTCTMKVHVCMYGQRYINYPLLFTWNCYKGVPNIIRLYYWAPRQFHHIFGLNWVRGRSNRDLIQIQVSIFFSDDGPNYIFAGLSLQYCDTSKDVIEPIVGKEDTYLYGKVSIIPASKSIRTEEYCMMEFSASPTMKSNYVWHAFFVLSVFVWIFRDVSYVPLIGLNIQCKDYYRYLLL
jgi:hypothetical protein